MRVPPCVPCGRLGRICDGCLWRLRGQALKDGSAVVKIAALVTAWERTIVDRDADKAALVLGAIRAVLNE